MDQPFCQGNGQTEELQALGCPPLLPSQKPKRHKLQTMHSRV